jgi:translation initiation factor 1 (eIF-1/SUI1)
MTIDRDLIDRLKARGEEVFTQISAELMSNPRFVKAMEGAMKGKAAAEEAAARTIKGMNIPTRTEFRKAVRRIDALESEVAELRSTLEKLRQATARGGTKKKSSAKKRGSKATKRTPKTAS